MKILLGYRVETYKGLPIETYARSFHYYLKQAGHTVLPVGEGHPFSDIDVIGDIWRSWDLWLDIEQGRNSKGDLRFQYADQTRKDKVVLPSAVRFVDTHGHPTLHHRAGKKYDHVFFAVWDQRDRFAGYPSAHWCPNASDERFFGKQEVLKHDYTIGFFGSKDGLDRADDLKRVCEPRRINYDIREIGRAGKHRWPETSRAMNQCKVLFNKAQKHDINQRIFESMLVGRPLLTDRDERCGLDKLFTEYEHYLGYANEVELGLQLDWCLSEMDNDNTLALDMAERAYNLVKEKHLVQHRVAQIMEITLASNQ